MPAALAYRTSYYRGQYGRTAVRLAALLAAATFRPGTWASENGCGFDLATTREAALEAGRCERSSISRPPDGGPVSCPLTTVIDLIRPDRMRRMSIFEGGKASHMVLIAGHGQSGNLERG